MNTHAVLNKGVLILGALLLLLLSAGPARPQAEDQKMRSLVFQNADVRSVFSMLADRGKINIVVSPTVTGQVTISLTDVTWKQALDIITKTYSLMDVEERGYIRIVPIKEYLVEQAEIEKRIAEQKLLTPLEIRIIPVYNASAVDMQKAVKSMLSERGKVEIDQRTNSLIVSELPKNIDRVEEFVKKLDLETKQIKISTQLIEIESRHLAELGINWSATYQDNSVGANLEEAVIQQNANQTSSPIADVTLKTSSVAWPDVQARITALVSDGKIKIVSHPEITTVDNKEALVQVGQKIPIKQFDASGNTVITFYDVGTVLKVIPHVTAENRILLQLRPDKSSYQFDPNGVIINTSNAVTNVVVENG
ncbi:MAG: secretin N-terminal domain-containing protein, partial [Limisphaerales bacterium]